MRRIKQMFRASDAFIIGAALLSMVFSYVLWFSGFKMEGLFVALWVPTIFCVGIYLKLLSFMRQRGPTHHG